MQRFIIRYRARMALIASAREVYISDDSSLWTPGRVRAAKTALSNM